MTRYLLTAPGPRPPYATVAYHLWGVGCAFDSDGDSYPADSTDWTELTVRLRNERGEAIDAERVDVDPLETEPLVLAIVSENADLARRAAKFLQVKAGGELSRN